MNFLWISNFFSFLNRKLSPLEIRQNGFSLTLWNSVDKQRDWRHHKILKFETYSKLTIFLLEKLSAQELTIFLDLTDLDSKPFKREIQIAPNPLGLPPRQV